MQVNVFVAKELIRFMAFETKRQTPAHRSTISMPNKL
jgi:hypothetical protein